MRTAIVALLAAGCGASEVGVLGTQENPLPQDSKTGPYQLTSTVDFTVEAVVPAQVELVIATLRDFSENPAHALISIADRAGVPAVQELYDALPDALEDRIEGWVNGEIDKVRINGKPLTEYAADLVGYAEIALTQFAVESELSIAESSAATSATHRLTALDLSPTGFTDLRVPITGLASDILTQEPEITVAPAGAITLGEQHFGLHYGEYAWQGLELVSNAVFGSGIRDTIGAAVNCPKLAQTISDKCFLGACVGHETEIRQICDGGLDAIVNFAHDKMAAMRVEVLHLAAGDGVLVDEDGDGIGDTIVDGVWDAELNIGLGLRHAPATFAGTR